MINHLPAQIKQIRVAAMLLLVAFSAFGQESTPLSQNASPLPPPIGFVNDYAGVIDPATKERIEAKLKNLKETTKVEIAVAVVKTTGDKPIFDYSLAVARGWGIGSKEDDSPAALLLVAIDDRKYFTQISRDLEDELPDGVAGSLQRQFLVPEFKKGNYGKGISDTLDAYIARIRGGSPVPAANRPPVHQPARGSDPLRVGAMIFFGILILLMFLAFVVMLITSIAKEVKDTDWGAVQKGDGEPPTATPWVGGSFGGFGGSGGFGGGGGFSGGGFGGGSSGGSFGGGGGFSGGGAGGSW